jgi:hypothetical protein
LPWFCGEGQASVLAALQFDWSMLVDRFRVRSNLEPIVVKVGERCGCASWS